jgi:hypothetical protein
MFNGTTEAKAAKKAGHAWKDPIVPRKQVLKHSIWQVSTVTV